MTFGRDGQPDILCGGDALRHGLHRWRSRADWLTRNISIELAAIRNPLSSPRRKAGARAWIQQAQGERRQALHNARAYEALMAEREMGTRLGLERLAG